MPGHVRAMALQNADLKRELVGIEADVEAKRARVAALELAVAYVSSYSLGSAAYCRILLSLAHRLSFSHPSFLPILGCPGSCAKTSRRRMHATTFRPRNQGTHNLFFILFIFTF